MSGPLIEAGDFLINLVFNFYILAVLLRFLMQLTRADFYNPVSQFLVTVTNPPLKPLRQVIPGFGGIDLAALVLVLLLEVIKLSTLSLLLYHMVPNGFAMLGLGVIEILRQLLNIYFFAIIIIAVLSWVNPGLHNPVTSILYGLTEPLMRPVRRVLPAISGLDLSPLVVLIGLQLVDILFLRPLTAYMALMTANLIR